MAHTDDLSDILETTEPEREEGLGRRGDEARDSHRS